MRSTLVIDDELFHRAKQRAAEQRTTLSAVVNAALREALAPRAVDAPRFAMVTCGDARTRVHHEPADMAAALDEDDRRSLR